MDGRKLGGILFTVIVIIAVVWMRMQRRSDFSQGVRQEAVAMVKSMESYSKHQKYLDQLAERAHRAAFDVAYTTGGRRQRDRFDDQKYLEAFFTYMIRSANADNQRDLVPELQALREKAKSADPSSTSG